MLKKVLIGIGAVVALLVLIALVLPLFINANTFKPTLESDLSGALGRKVEIGNISLSIFSGGVKVDGFSVADDPAFSPSPFLTAKQLTAGVSLFPLIFSKRLEVKSFTISDPHVTLLRSPSGRWNYSSLGPANSASAKPAPQTAATQPPAAQQSSTSSSSANNFSVGELKLKNGLMTVAVVGSDKTRRYEDVNLEASNVSYTAEFPFQLTAKTPGGGSIKLDGKAGPIDQTDASLTPFNATLNVQNLDLASTGFIESSSGVGGIVSFDGSLSSNGREMASKGTVKAEKVRFAPDASPATVPVNIDYATTYDLHRNVGTLSQGQIRIGKAVANLGGTYNAAGTTTTLDMKMEGKAMPVPDLEGVLPAVGVKLPSGASLQTGGLDLALAITGPIDKLVITGPVNLSNAKLAGFNLTGKLGALASFAGIGKRGSADTEIQTLSTNLRVDPQGTHAQNLNLVVPSIGAMTGNGNVSPTGQLDCRMIAKLGTNNLAGVATTALASLTGGGTNNGIPFKITGTTSSPVFTPDLSGMAGNTAKGATGTAKGTVGAAQGLLGGFLKKKPKQPQP
ncbi:MAG TPA: AsmA family protein [Candidatus Acidoferrales bacterium]|nr:AsmA family protein [Candidatus Acidoferrales bacterium]